MTEEDGFPDPVDETTLRQRRAATPAISAWVSANAGSGKTHVLANRVIRLLLSGVRPSAILCLTYTKAAAAEMSNRVFRILGDWTRLDDATLAAAIAALEGRAALAGELIRARQLFALALETPGGLKIQTIHGFCEAVLHRFPLEADIPGNFSVLDDAAAGNLLAEARRIVFSAAGQERNNDLRRAIETVLDAAGEKGFETLLRETYARRREIGAFLSAAQRTGDGRARLCRCLGIGENEGRDEVEDAIWPIPGLPVDYLRAIYAAADGPKPKKTALGFAADLLSVADLRDRGERLALVRTVFCRDDGTARAFTNVTKPVRGALPDIDQRVQQGADHVRSVLLRLAAHDVLETGQAALTVAARYIAAFDQLKRRQALLDFDDLIHHTEALLSRSGAGAWVHYKLDQGIDHILVDEAQDTAPSQWNVIASLTGEFFAGTGARPANRTVFSVGDEKQSIYSFQGARPERFAQERATMARRAAAAGCEFESIPLRVSFRSTAEVLSLVDLVFGNADARRGLGEESDAIVHASARPRAPGHVELWDMIAAEKKPQSESWTDPFDHVPETAPPARLARRIAATLEAWIGRERIVDARTGKARFVRPGDILVLVRKRDGFVPTLLRMLKAAANPIPVAGADRLRLTDHIAVQDLVALGRHMLLEGDDLSLAGLVKSPLVGLGEDDLFRLAAGRPEGLSLAGHLRRLAEGEPRFAAFEARLARWREAAARLSVHDFYATVLGPDGGRERFLSRLGSEVADVLDEFLALALDQEHAGIPGLQAFISMLDAQSPEIKREMEAGVDAVRVMTVHASKGLEAPVVFLVDQGGEAFQARNLPAVWMLPSRPGAEDAVIPVWLPGKEHRAVEAAAAALETFRAEAEEEYRRLLYVGLTRAADRLVVCGYSGLRGARTPTWHSLVADGFDHSERDPRVVVSTRERVVADDRFETRVLVHAGRAAAAPETGERAPEGMPAGSFDCPESPLPPPRRLPRPLVPSGAGVALGSGEAGEVAVSPFAAAGAEAEHLERGKAAHRLLQVLPSLPPESRAEAAARYVGRALPALGEPARQALLAQVKTILEDGEFAPVFGGQGATEISVMGQIRVGGEIRVVSGRIDRMAVFDDHVLVVDYKTGRPGASGRPDPAHILQLAVYRALLRPLYPGRDIRAALVYTALPRLVPLSAEELDAALAALA